MLHFHLRQPVLPSTLQSTELIPADLMAVAMQVRQRKIAYRPCSKDSDAEMIKV